MDADVQQGSQLQAELKDRVDPLRPLSIYSVSMFVYQYS